MAKRAIKRGGGGRLVGVSGISTRQVAKQYGQARGSGLRGRAAESAAYSSGAGSGG